jgi:hypothetical protein
MKGNISTADDLTVADLMTLDPLVIGVDACSAASRAGCASGS